MPITVSTDRVVIDTVVKKKGEWRVVEMNVPDSVIDGMRIGPFRAIKPTIVRGVALFFGKTHVYVPVRPAIRCERGDNITVTLEL